MEPASIQQGSEPPATTALATLRLDHEKTLRVLRDLEAATAALGEGPPTSHETCDAIARAVAHFGCPFMDQLRREEGTLLGPEGPDPLPSSLATLVLEEDEALERLVRLELPAAADAALRTEPAEEAALAELRRVVRALGLLLREHIDLEERELFQGTGLT